MPLGKTQIPYQGLSKLKDSQQALTRNEIITRYCQGVKGKAAYKMINTEQPDEQTICFKFRYTCDQGEIFGDEDEIDASGESTGYTKVGQVGEICKPMSDVFNDSSSGNNGGGCNGGGHDGGGYNGGGNCGGDGTGTIDVSYHGMCFGACLNGPCAKVCGKYITKGKGLLGGRLRRCERCERRLRKYNCLSNFNSGGSCFVDGRKFVCTRCNEQLDCANGAGEWCDPMIDVGPRKLTRKERRRMRREARRERRRGGGEEYCEDCEVASNRPRRERGKFWKFLGDAVQVAAPLAAGVYLGKLGLENCTKVYDTYSQHKADAGETIPAPNCQSNALGGYAGFGSPWSTLGGGGNIGLNANIGVQGNLYNNANMGGQWPNYAYNSPNLGLNNSINGIYSPFNANVHGYANGNLGNYFPQQPFGNQFGNQFGNNNPWLQNQFNNPGSFYGNNYFGPSAQDLSRQRTLWNPGISAGNGNVNNNLWGNQFYSGQGNNPYIYNNGFNNGQQNQQSCLGITC